MSLITENNIGRKIKNLAIFLTIINPHSISSVHRSPKTWTKKKITDNITSLSFTNFVSLSLRFGEITQIKKINPIVIFASATEIGRLNARIPRRVLLTLSSSDE